MASNTETPAAAPPKVDFPKCPRCREEIRELTDLNTIGFPNPAAGVTVIIAFHRSCKNPIPLVIMPVETVDSMPRAPEPGAAAQEETRPSLIVPGR